MATITTNSPAFLPPRAKDWRHRRRHIAGTFPNRSAQYIPWIPYQDEKGKSWIKYK